jgi:hypothetical protein
LHNCALDRMSRSSKTILNIRMETQPQGTSILASMP